MGVGKLPKWNRKIPEVRGVGWRAKVYLESLFISEGDDLRPCSEPHDGFASVQSCQLQPRPTGGMRGRGLVSPGVPLFSGVLEGLL